MLQSWAHDQPALCQILSDTKALQKEINSLSGKLDRTFAVTDELVFKVRGCVAGAVALREPCPMEAGILRGSGKWWLCRVLEMVGGIGGGVVRHLT